jgi:hypothetical protein
MDDAFTDLFTNLPFARLRVRTNRLQKTNQKVNMKPVLTVMLLALCHSSTAQFVKGDKFLAGGFTNSIQNSTTGNDDDLKYRSFQVYPEMGFFLNERHAVGGGLSYSTTTSKYEYQGNFQENGHKGIGVHGFVKSYFPITEKFFFSVDGTIGYERGRSTTDTGTSESTSKSYSLSFFVSPSLVFFPSQNWAIEGGIGGLGLSHSRGLSDDSHSTSFGLNYGSFSLGFAYFFRSSAE